MCRDRYTPKRKRVEPGGIDWLYGESLEPGDGRTSPKDRKKVRRIRPEGTALLKKVAKDLGFSFQHVRRVALGDIHSDRVMEAINVELDIIVSRETKDAALPESK